MHTASRSLRALSRTQGRAISRSMPGVHGRAFSAAGRMAAVKPFVLADIGEGIKEVQIIQWFVQPGARVEQFDKICEVQSDKASVDITSRFDGVIKKLYYEPDAMAQVGKPLLDIDITGDVSAEDEKLLQPTEEEAEEKSNTNSGQPATSAGTQTRADHAGRPEPPAHPPLLPPQSKTSSSDLATPAVRGLLKEHGVSISDVSGTGRDGRVSKEDVHSFVAARDSVTAQAPLQQGDLAPPQPIQPSQTPLPLPPPAAPQEETPAPLTPMQSAMYRSMTRSLNVPHFMCADEVDFTELNALRKAINASPPHGVKISGLAFIVKAVSLALLEFPLLNSRLVSDSSSTSNSTPSSTSAGSNSHTPQLYRRSQHNISIAIASPAGLVVPNIKSVQSLSIVQIASELLRLRDLAQRTRLTRADLSGGTITVSNIGSIGGTYAVPRIVEGELAILATGRVRDVPRFAVVDDGGDKVMKRSEAVFSWAADHRVVDGATLATFQGRVRELLESPGRMVVELR